MVRKTRAILVLTALWWAGMNRGHAQEPSLPPALPTAPTVASAVPGPATPLPTPALAAPCSCYEDRNGPLLISDPLLDPPSSPPGFFSAVEVGIVSPLYKNRLFNTVPIPGLPDQFVQVPTATLNWTASPQFTVGYRFGEGCGEAMLSYRFLVADGSGSIANFDAAGAGALQSRLNVNVADLDYGSREYSLGRWWDMKWKVGARFATNYFSSRAQGGILEQQVTNNYYGAGPHAGLELARRFGCTNWSWFGKTDSALTIGRIHQNFEEIIALPGMPPIGGAVNADPPINPGVGHTQYVPMVRVQTGLGWVPSPGTPLRLQVGYEFEGWWWVGRLPGPTVGNTSSTANFFLNGIFFRGEWRY